MTTLARAPLSPVMTWSGLTGVGCDFMQYGSALMLMGLKLGGAPSRVTEPVTSPTVDGSIVAVAAGALAGCSDVSDSFLPQPAKTMASAATNNKIRQFFIVRSLLLLNCP